MIEVLQGFLVLVFGVISVVALALAFRVWRSGDDAYRRNRDRTPSILAAMRDEVRTRTGGARDYQVAAGLAVDLRTNQWVEQGRLSGEAISEVLSGHKQG